MSEGEVLTFRIDGEPDELMREVFAEVTGGVCFGPTGRSSATRDELREWSRFRDYLMEGFVAYDLRVSSEERGITIEVRPTGSGRDRYLDSHIRWILTSIGAGFLNVAR